MTDPYKVLGISENATDEQVKDAYRKMARKYHPDNYANNPLADLATEKMKEINEAYDQILKMRKEGVRYGSGSGQSSGYGGYQGGYQRTYQQTYQSGYGGSSQFADIRNMINHARIHEAEELLDGIPASRRDAEWHFLKGHVCYSKGWLDDAVRYVSTACQMAPGNQEYRAVYQRLVNQRQTGQAPGGMMGSTSCCELCAAAYCMSMCCR